VGSWANARAGTLVKNIINNAATTDFVESRPILCEMKSGSKTASRLDEHVSDTIFKPGSLLLMMIVMQNQPCRTLPVKLRLLRFITSSVSNHAGKTPGEH
jgi:hypothetical protein